MHQSAKTVAVVVDDNALILMAACGILEDAGFACLDASSGEEAWDHVAAHGGRIALLFSDIQMPGGMDGLALAHRVHQAYPEVEIVLASGHVRPVPADMPPRCTFIAKPFTGQIVTNHLAGKFAVQRLDGAGPFPG